MVKREGYWPRHPNKEIQFFLIELDEAGWVIAKSSKYYRVLCDCGAHKAHIHLTPSNPYYLNDIRRYLIRYTCLGNSREAEK